MLMGLFSYDLLEWHIELSLDGIMYNSNIPLES